MPLSLSRLLGLCLCAGLLVLSLGCKSTEQSDASSSSSPAPTAAPGPDLAPTDDAVRTIQLYPGGQQDALPVVTLNSGDALTLEFDLVRSEGRPLSVYFQHADRTWRRDLSASQVLASFQDDRLLEYQSSRGTDVPYVHYQYEFPNDDIRFQVSGNYILRVTERGRRDSVLFEQPFFVTEKEGGLRLGAESLMVPGQSQSSLRPIARYTPPAEIRGDPFGHAVCFVRNSRLADTRCRDRPTLARQPELKFQLHRDRAYAPTTTGYTLDLSTLRASSQIARIDRSASPIRALLDPDYARFGGGIETGRMMNGQTIIRGALSSRLDPALSAEYVEASFAFVPAGETPYSSPLVVAGSFSGMNPERGTRMEWNESQGRYEGRVLLKQGRYQYFYATSDPAFAAEVQNRTRRMTGTYTAFVYYRDARRNTDRLLQVSGFSPR